MICVIPLYCNANLEIIVCISANKQIADHDTDICGVQKLASDSRVLQLEKTLRILVKSYGADKVKALKTGSWVSVSFLIAELREKMLDGLKVVCLHVQLMLLILTQSIGFFNQFVDIVDSVGNKASSHSDLISPASVELCYCGQPGRRQPKVCVAIPSLNRSLP